MIENETRYLIFKYISFNPHVRLFLLLGTTFKTNTDCLYVQLYRCTYLDAQRSNGAYAINIKCCSNISLLQNLIRVECMINADDSIELKVCNIILYLFKISIYNSNKKALRFVVVISKHIIIIIIHFF